MGKMSRSYNRRHEKEGHDFEEGSSARPRPLSYEEIMLRRKDNKLCGNVVAEEGVDLGNVPGEGTVENVSETFEPEWGEKRDKNLAGDVEEHFSEEPVKESSGKKETYSSKSPKMEEDGVKGRVRRRNESEGFKDKAKRDSRSEARGDKNDRRVHGRRNTDESVKKQSWDYSTRKERDLERSRGEHERETKRKYQHEHDEKIRDRYAAKKHDSGKLHALEISERKERKESSKSQIEESRRNRGRSGVEIVGIDICYILSH